MKKHVFGVALFSLIVASFVFIYAFFYSPSIPPKEAVKPPVPRTEKPAEKPYTCPSRSNKISYTVQSSELDIKNYKFVSRITISWDGSGTPPKKINVEPHLFTLQNVERSLADSKTLMTPTISEPFKNGNKATLTIKSDLPKDGFITGDDNIYVVFNFFDAENGSYLTKTDKSVPEAYQVLLILDKKPAVFGKDPVLRFSTKPIK
jgi:hypothetical protein